MKKTSRRKFIMGVTAGYAAFGAAWILLSDRLLTVFVMPSTIIEFGVAKGLAFIAVTTTLLFVALHLVPPEESDEAPMETRLRAGPYRVVAAALPVIAAFLTQWAFWSILQPFAWFLFFPAVFIASWVGGVFSGILATGLSTLLAWWAFMPFEQSFALARPQSGVAVGMFFAMGVLFSLAHERLRRAEKKAAEAKFRGLMEQALAGIYILQGGRVRYANRELARMFGYPGAGAVVERLGLAELAAPEDFRSLDDDARRCLSGELPELRRNFVGVRRDGALIDVETHALRLEFEGAPAIIGIALDVTQRRRAEEALRRSETLLRAVVDGSTDAVFVKDAAGRYLLFNDAAGRFVGKSPDQVKGRDDSEVFPPDVAATLRALDRLVMENGKVNTREENLRTLDGRQLDFLVTKGPIFDEKGNVVGLFGVSRDVTESRQAQTMLRTLNQRLESEVAARTEELKATEERARLILQSSGAGMFGCGLDGRITFANPAAGRMLNCAAEDLIGADAHRLLACADAASPLDAVLSLGEAAVDDNAAFLRPDGRFLSVSYAAEPMRRDDAAGGSVVVGAVVSFTDISERRAAEEAREQALQESKRLAQSRSAFLANMSHEIRTPLNAVLGLAQVGALKGDGRQAQPLFQQILDSGRQLLEIVDDVLDYSKIEAGKLTVESGLIDPGVALDRAVAQVAERAAEKRLRFVVEEAAGFPARCRGDALRLSQILANLLSNAVKFTDNDGAVTVTARVEENEDGRPLTFAVADTGVGVGEEHLPNLFTPFEQADTSITRRFGGTGLGLSICKRLAEAMGGEIRVSSRLGEGSRFELRLPLIDAEPPPPLPAALTVCACGLSADEAALLGDALAERGVRLLLSVPGPCAAAEADLYLIDAACLRDDAAAAAFQRKLAQGGRVVLACWPMAAFSLPAGFGERLPRVERPLRARQIVAALTAPPPAAPSPARGRRLTGYRLLLAEDNEVNQLVAREMLELEGARTICVANGRLAVERVLQDGASAFDAVLTDVQMPDMDGYETAQRLKEIAPNLPVIGLTAHAMPEERARCLAAGMVEHVTKPVDIDKLTAAVRRCARSGGKPAVPPADQAPANQAPILATPADATPADATLIDAALTDATLIDATLIDWAGLAARYAGKREFIARLTATVREAHADDPATLRRAVASGDFDAAAFRAHSVKSMAGNIMSAPVQAAATEAESAARRRDPSAARLILILADLLDRLLAALAEHDSTGAQTRNGTAP